MDYDRIRFLRSLDWALPCSRLVPQIWTHQSIRLLYFRKSYQCVLNLQNREQNIKMQRSAFLRKKNGEQMTFLSMP